jgi:hypothetical protein
MAAAVVPHHRHDATAQHGRRPLDIVLTLQWDLPRGFNIETDVAGQVHLFPHSEDGREAVTTAAVVTARPFFGLGKRF